MAQKFNSDLHLVIAFDGTDPSPQSANRRHAEGTLESIATGYAGKTFTHAFPGDPVDTILHIAAEIDADLIVVGNKGMRGAGRVLGSVPNSIAHKAPCAVMIVSTT